MRKDPPFDLEYLTSIWLLSQAERDGARVFNNPAAMRDHNEKLGILEFPQFVAPTLVTRDPDAVHAFIDEQRDVILKRLDGMGGESIFRVRVDDPNRNVIVETMTQGGARSDHGAALPPGDQGRRQARAADRRQAGAALRSRASPSPARRAPTSPPAGAASRSRCRRSDREIAEALGPVLAARGLLLVGLDVIGELPHRGQRHQPDLLPRNPGPDRIRCCRNVFRCPGTKNKDDDAMIGILIVAHGAFGEALIHSASHVLGKRPLRVRQVGVTVHDDPEAILPQAQDLVRQLDEGDGVLVLTDIYGATPGNIALKLLVPGRVEGIVGRQPADADPRPDLPRAGARRRGRESAFGRHRGRDTHDHGFLRQGSRSP